MVTTTASSIDEAKRDAFAERVFKDALGFADTLAVYIGDRLGLYDALRQGDAITSVELARRTSLDERYIREWLEHQAATGIIDLVADSREPSWRYYAISPEHAEVLTDRESVNWLAPLVREMAGTTSVLPRLVDAFRTGDGIPYADYGLDVIEGQADINRATFLQLLGNEWLPAVPDVDAVLRNPGARIADIGCGAGWSAIAIARAYPHVRIDGFDLDEASIALARRNIEEAGVSDRVQVHLRDAAAPELRGQYDLVLAFECVHDLSRPVDVLRAMRELTNERGAVIVMDERTGEQFTAPADDLDRLFYGWSLLLCLPSGLADQPSAATGTVMRPAMLDCYAEDAGFSRMEILPIEHAAFRFYRLWK